MGSRHTAPTPQTKSDDRGCRIHGIRGLAQRWILEWFAIKRLWRKYQAYVRLYDDTNPIDGILRINKGQRQYLSACRQFGFNSSLRVARHDGGIRSHDRRPRGRVYVVTFLMYTISSGTSLTVPEALMAALIAGLILGSG